VKGDVIIVEDHHRSAAAAIRDHLLRELRERVRASTVSIAGESGSGKSEMGQALREALDGEGLATVVFGQDDYFVYPPRTNDAARRRDVSWVGPQEVRLALLDEHLAAVRDGATTLVKPLVEYAEDRIVEETLTLEGVRVAIAEGTYTSLLENLDRRIFIARSRVETLDARKRRARERFDPFIEEVLEIEHGIISQHRALADIVITRDYDVEFVRG
jgi:uridine kinase